MVIWMRIIRNGNRQCAIQAIKICAGRVHKKDKRIKHQRSKQKYDKKYTIISIW